MFSERGFEHSKLTDVAGQMDMSKTFIYHYFSSKHDLIEQITLDTQERLSRLLKGVFEGPGDNAAKVLGFMLVSADFVDANYHELRTANYSFAGSMPGGLAVIAQRNNDESLALLVGVVQQGIDAGEFRPGSARSIGRAIFSLMHSLPRWYKPGGPTPARVYAADFFTLLAPGLLVEGRPVPVPSDHPALAIPGPGTPS